MALGRGKLLITAMVIGLLGAWLLPPRAEAQLVNQVVAVVAKDVITLQELDDRIAEHIDELRQKYKGAELKKQIADLRHRALEVMINDRLAEHEARQMGFKVSDADVDLAIQGVLDTNKMNKLDLERSLAVQGLTWDAYREKVRTQILQSQLVYGTLRPKIFIPKEAKLKLYKERQDKYGGSKELVLGRIVLGLDQRQLGENLVKRLDGGADFAALAKEFSIGPEGKQGGQLGSFSLDQLSANLKQALTGLKPGQHTNLIQSAGGYQIFQLIGRKVDPGKSFEAVEPQLTEELVNRRIAAKFESWIAEVRKRSFVKVMPIKD